ncbi:MAG: carboxymuconolactone decarboxylase family protein [Chitinophaga sp.]|uniref:carboxymuconolactone decarboxylase family protein n=1 Tax=Chitinophaga sp. TaxID=1869181 RepID=UPI0025C0605A|nr:carboxymuconolactone decarboxylase family protein [Chitinophaga sp.]MBV8252119.1 carboxymuconolactone decarboxylase family protein [Chitinophaga sp.]
MKARITFQEVNKGFMDGLYKTGGYIKHSGIDPVLLELINFRVSTINGCAFCLDMHYKDAIHMGEDPKRLYSLAAWRECPYYSDAERAALAYTEEVTKLNIQEETYANLTKHFTKAQIADITLAISMINTWNRLNIAFHTVPGGYVVGTLG